MSRLPGLASVSRPAISSLVLGVLGLALLTSLCLAARPAAAQPDAISGLYVHETDPRATVKLLLAPSEKDGMPVGRVWGVVSYKDPRARADSCMFEFQSTIKSDVITCRDALNPGCNTQLRLQDRTVILDTSDECLAVYCKGHGTIPRGVYVLQPKRAKKSRRR
jgi:hypothetical protein